MKYLFLYAINLIFEITYLLFAVFTAIVGKHINDSVFWAIIDFFFAPLVWVKWMLFEQVSISTISHSFDFFFK